MSFSFIVVAKTKQAAKDQVAVEMDKVVSYQPSHTRDQALVNSVTAAYLDLVGEPPEGQSLSVSVNGGVSWRSTPESPYAPAEDELLTGSSFGVQVYYILGPKL